MIRAHAALPLALALLLAACGQSPEVEAALPPDSPYAGGAQYPWTDALSPSDRLSAQSLSAGTHYLSDLSWLSAKSGWGPVERDRSNGEQDVGDGRQLRLGAQRFTKGLGVHADSDLRFALNRQCTALHATIGIDHEVGPRGSVVFEVLGDGKLLYSSGVLTGKSKAQDINVGVEGVAELALVVRAGSNNYYDHADWANARVECAAASEQPGMTLSTNELAIFHMHSATLEATFKGVTGLVDLRLAAPSGYENYATLEMPSVNVTGAESSYGIVFSAPGELSTYLFETAPQATYTLIASQNGQDFASVPITLSVKPMDVTVQTEPSRFTASPGATARFTLTVKLNPPLPKSLPLTLQPLNPCGIFQYNSGECVKPLGATYGNGGEMKRDFEVKFVDVAGIENYGTLTESLIVMAGDLLGWRKPLYRTTETTLTWDIQPKTTP